MRLALGLDGIWLRYATLQTFIPSFPWIALGWRVGAQSKERKGSNFAICQPWSQVLRGVPDIPVGNIADATPGVTGAELILVVSKLEQEVRIQGCNKQWKPDTVYHITVY